MDSGGGAGALPPAGSPIRAPRDRRPCAPPPGLSRLAAPFIGFLRQGIRREPVVSSLSAARSTNICKVSKTWITSVMVTHIAFCIAIADATLAPPGRGDARFVSMDFMRTVRIWKIHTNVSISMKRYAAVRVRGAGALGGGCWKGPGRQAPSPRVKTVSP